MNSLPRHFFGDRLAIDYWRGHGVLIGVSPSHRLRLVFRLGLCWRRPRWVSVDFYRYTRPLSDERSWKYTYFVKRLYPLSAKGTGF